MSVCILLILKLIPLYILIGVGYGAGKFLRVQKETIASLVVLLSTLVALVYIPLMANVFLH